MIRPPSDAAIPPPPFLQQKFKVTGNQQNNTRVSCILISVYIYRSHTFLVSGLPCTGLRDGRGHLYHRAAAHPPLYHVLLCGQQLVQLTLPKRNSASQFSKYLDLIHYSHISCIYYLYASVCGWVPTGVSGIWLPQFYAKIHQLSREENIFQIPLTLVPKPLSLPIRGPVRTK